MQISKPWLSIIFKASSSIKSQTIAPFELNVSKAPIIVASAIFNSISSISNVDIIVFFIFLESPFLTKANLSLALQKTPRLGFSLKCNNSRWDIFYTLLNLINLEFKCFLLEISVILTIIIPKQVRELYKFNHKNDRSTICVLIIYFKYLSTSFC